MKGTDRAGWEGNNSEARPGAPSAHSVAESDFHQVAIMPQSSSGFVSAGSLELRGSAPSYGRGEEDHKLDKSSTEMVHPEIERGPSSQASIRVLSRLGSLDHNLRAPAPKPSNPFMAFLGWWVSWAIPGMGMFSEAYMIFAIGNIKPFLKIDYPNCIGLHEPLTCNKNTVDSIEYVEICGIITGMLALGFAGDIIGRKWGSRLTMLLMFIGGCLLTSAYGSSDAQFLSVFLFSLFFYGIGVGGEYPMASSSAAERAEGSAEMRKRRGETVVLTFSQQGWGNFANTLVIIILLAMQGATQAVSPKQAEIVWRVQFAIGTFICLVVTVYRWLYLEESEVWKAEHKDIDDMAADLEQEERAGAAGQLTRDHWKLRLAEYWLLAKFYAPRMFVTCAGWVANDFAFYGNRLFQSTFIEIISGPSSPQFEQKQWTLLNSGVALVGYYVAAFTIDKAWWGRRRMQAFGFLMMFALFLLCGLLYNTLLSEAIQVFQFLYFFSSFWNQFGPNCTTWLVAGEVYPTDVRAFSHGISAAFGKAGAAIASVIFTRITQRNTFYASAIAGVVGFIITIVFLPDTTGLDLGEIDRMNKYMITGKYDEYSGEAVNPKYLSLYERWRGYGKHYDPTKDSQQRKLQLGE